MSTEDNKIPEWFPEKLKWAVELYNHIDGDGRATADNPEYQHVADALTHIVHNDAFSLTDEDYTFYGLIAHGIECGDINIEDKGNIDIRNAFCVYVSIKDDFAEMLEQTYGTRDIDEIVEKDLPKKPYTRPSGLGGHGLN